MTGIAWLDSVLRLSKNITRCLASAVRLKLLNLRHPFLMVTIACTLVGSTQAQRADLELQSASDSL